MPIDQLIGRLPFLWRYAHHFRARFPGTIAYWEHRYSEGGNSGAGSYGRLATFKAEVLNDFVLKQNIASVIELGCGDGHQLKLARYPSYIGLDISKTAIQRNIAQFADDRTKSFLWYDPQGLADAAGFLAADLALSQDVIFHLVEDASYVSYMQQLFSAARRFVAIYSSNENRYISNTHERHRRFTDYVSKYLTDWEMFHHIPNPFPYVPSQTDTSFCDFYFYRKRAPDSLPSRGISVSRVDALF